MSDCQSCSQFPELQASGYVLLYCKEEHLRTKLKASGLKIIEEGSLYKLHYATYEELDILLNQLGSYITLIEQEQLFCSYISNELVNDRFPNMVSFPKFYQRLINREYVTIINQRLFTQHMQPIFNLREDKAYGYEFLLRPVSQQHAFFPGELFAFSQKAGLQSNLDSQARIASIEVSSKLLSKGIKRFINFLPSSIYDPTHCLKSTFKVVESHDVDPNDLVFEVVETEKIADINHLKKIFQTYQAAGMKVALDDLGSGYSTLEVLKELKPNFAKIDRELIDHCDQSSVKQQRIREIVEVADAFGMTLLAEGIERKEEVDFCKDINIPLVQGYYFGKPDAKPLAEHSLLVN